MVQAIAPFPNIAGVFKNLALRVAQLLSSFLSFEDQYHQNLCRLGFFVALGFRPLNKEI